MTPPPLFSVIVTTYERPQFLPDAIASVLGQSVADLECIVVDDASPTPAVVPPDPRIRLVRRTQSGGPAAARNTGLSLAAGRYVTFLDDDDLYTPDRLQMTLAAMERSPVTICWIRFLDEVEGTNRTLDGWVHDVILEHWVPHIGTVTARREAVVAFDERYIASEDAEWWIRMSERHPLTTLRQVGYMLRNHNERRHRVDWRAGVQQRLKLLRHHAAYFASRPRAAAFQWRVIGLSAGSNGDYAVARRALFRALRCRFDARTAWHFARMLRVSHATALSPTEDLFG